MSCTRIYKNVKITVTTGDITQQQVDAIINPANSQLIMGGGVAGAIKCAEGREIENQATEHAPTPVGRAVATSAGKLKAKYVIHAPTMERPAMNVGTENVRLATSAALKCAERLKVRSIAFPGLGTGVGGVSSKEAANAMVNTLKEHLDKGSHLREALLVGFSKELTDAFQRAVEKILS
jgi:O-acetyl-ADP-ribose deacetylase (regulator of RNase III)